MSVKVVTFKDYTRPNEALEHGDVGANSFQLKPYLDNQIKTPGYHISIVGPTAVWPIGLYSHKHRTVAEVPSGAKIGVPNDPSNKGRALMLLEHVGLIELRESAAIVATATDIVSNPKKIQLRELDAGSSATRSTISMRLCSTRTPRPSRRSRRAIMIVSDRRPDSATTVRSSISIRRHLVFMKIAYALGVGAAIAFASPGPAEAVPTSLEGAAGGGVAAWAILAPDAPLVSYTNLKTNDYTVQSIAVSGTLLKRLELSYGAQLVDAPTVGNALNLSSRAQQNTFGAKFKLLDAKPKTFLPAVALGVQFKQSSGQILDALENAGAIKSESGTDFYLAATKIFGVGGKNVIIDGTLRATQGNEFGFFGFGGGRLASANNHYDFLPEFSAGVFVADNVAVGGEYRFKPNNISSTAFGFREDASKDLWIAFFPNKDYAITAAYVNLGQVGPSSAAIPKIDSVQDGLYLQFQANL